MDPRSNVQRAAFSSFQAMIQSAVADRAARNRRWCDVHALREVLDVTDEMFFCHDFSV